MPSTLLENDLRKQLDSGSAVVVVGAGVSIGATAGEKVAGWQGLLHDGVSRCQSLPTTGVKPAEATAMHSLVDSGDLDTMLVAAEWITRKLGGPDGGEWRMWLRETVGALRPRRSEVLEALRDLGAPLATTNYDGLLEEVTGLAGVTWRDGARVERVLRGDEQGILHLHGHWQQPESVILGVRDYQRVLGDAHAQTMQRAIRSFRTLVFVGCGEGLHDPNFGALLEWSAGVFGGSEYRHFRLALHGEVASLQAKHPPEQRTFVVGYGPGHSDLAPFLRQIRPVPASAAPPAAGPVHAPLLPPAPRCFGRDSVVEDLVANLLADSPRPVPILGPPGIGKSTVTLVALNDPRVAERYGARRFFIRCDAAQTREALAAEIATALGLPLGPQIEPAVLAGLGSAPTVLAVDNAETPWEGDTLRVEEFLAHVAALPGLALIASIRGASRPFGVSWRQPVQPLSLSAEHARAAFLAIAGDRFAADPLLGELLTALDGVPLAITLMAFTAEGEPNLEGTWRRWQRERTSMLQRPGATHRQLNIEVSYETSIRGPRMTEDARRLLSVLGFLPDGVAHPDVESVFPTGGLRAATVLRQVGLAFDEGIRLRLLAPLRSYVQREHVPAADDLSRAVGHYVDLVHELGGKTGKEGGDQAIERLAPESSNIEAAILRALSQDDPVKAIGAARRFGEFVRFTGLGTTTPLQAAKNVAQGREAHDLTASCTEKLGDVALARSEYEQARACYEEAIPLYKVAGGVLGEANCLQSLGDVALNRSEYEQALARFEEAIPLFQRVGNVLGEANCIQSLGDLALRRAEQGQARARYEEALLLYRRVDSFLGEANCIVSLGDTALHTGDHERARAWFEEAIPLYRRVGIVLGEANCIRSLGEIALQRTQYEQARSRFEEALPLYRRVGSFLGEANCIHSLGRIALAVGDHEQARTRLLEALSLFERLADPHSIGSTHYLIAQTVVDDSRLRHLDSARKAWQSIGRDDLVSEFLERSEES